LHVFEYRVGSWSMLVIWLLLLRLQMKLGVWILVIVMLIVNVWNACCRLIRFFCLFLWISFELEFCNLVSFLCFLFLNLYLSMIPLISRWFWQKKLLCYSQKMGINTTTSMTCSACGLYLMIHIILTCLCDVEVSLCVQDLIM
jgi:hypothetical protein